MKKDNVPKWLKGKMEGVNHYRLLFTDVVGNLKEMKITNDEIREILKDGQGFDGSSIQGFARLEESDLMAHPRLNSFRILPPSISGNGKPVGIFFCDIKKPNGQPFTGCPRQLLKKIRNKAKKLGYSFMVGPEVEFFLFRSKESLELLDSQGYFDATSEGPGNQIVEKMVEALQSIGVHVECSHHEVAPSQFEIDVKYQEVLTAADQVMLIKWVIQQIAELNNVYACFAPKPVEGENGSGMHVHMSLFKGDKNVFHDSKHEFNLSIIARRFCAGILHHVNGFTAITNSNVNSFKRLIEGFEAPVYHSWGRRNRSSLVRVPLYRVGKEKATRIELRSPDPCANPYLAFGAMLAAGLDGIEKKLKLARPIEDNIFHMSDEERRKLKIQKLPDSLQEAIGYAEKSAFLKKALGRHIWTAYLNNLHQQWDKYRQHVSTFEKKYFI